MDNFLIWTFHASKLFAKGRYPRVKFNEKHDGDVAEPVQSTVLELCPNFIQKWGTNLQKCSPEPPKVVSP